MQQKRLLKVFDDHSGSESLQDAEVVLPQVKYVTHGLKSGTAVLCGIQLETFDEMAIVQIDFILCALSWMRYQQQSISFFESARFD